MQLFIHVTTLLIHLFSAYVTTFLVTKITAPNDRTVYEQPILMECRTKSLWLNFQYYPINWLEKTDVTAMEESSEQQIYVLRFEPETLRIRNIIDNHKTAIVCDVNRVTSQHSVAHVVRHCAIYVLNGTDETWTSTFRKAPYCLRQSLCLQALLTVC